MARALKATAQVPADYVEINPSTLKRLADEMSGEGEMVDEQYLHDLLAKELSTSDVLTDTEGRKIVTGTATTAKTTKTVAAKTAATKTTAKVATMKSAKVVHAPTKKVDRVAADVVVGELKRLGLSKSQAAAACGVSPSLVTEWTGGGRHNLLAASRWTEVRKTLATFAKGIK